MNWIGIVLNCNVDVSPAGSLSSCLFRSLRSASGFFADFLFIHSPGVTTDVHYINIDRLDGSVQKEGETGFRLCKS